MSARRGCCLVTILRAYLDDSRNGPWVTIGGCLAFLDAWERFEPLWQQHLDAFGVPWLHMKQFNNPDPAAKPYGHLKGDNQSRSVEFMAASEAIINEHSHQHPGCSVRVPDLEAFNAKYGLQLDPYSLAIYGCIIRMRRLHTDPIQLVIDRFDKAQSRTERALGYAASDCGENLMARDFTTTHLGGAESFRTILPMQAADFVAYETCKYRSERTDMILSPEIRENPDLMSLAIRKWEDKNKPRDRKSFQALRDGAAFRVRHFTWETYDLEQLRERHPNGWGA
jgi:hypothetical protein